MKMTQRKLRELQNKGIIRQELDGSIVPAKGAVTAAPQMKPDNKKRSWKIHSFERDWEGFITSVEITEKP